MSRTFNWKCIHKLPVNACTDCTKGSSGLIDSIFRFQIPFSILPQNLMLHRQTNTRLNILNTEFIYMYNNHHIITPNYSSLLSLSINDRNMFCITKCTPTTCTNNCATITNQPNMCYNIYYSLLPSSPKANVNIL